MSSDKPSEIFEFPPCTRPRYTLSQLTAYFNHIHLPRSSRHHSITALSSSEQLTYLTRLLKHHLVTVPWENLGQHYSWHHVVDVSPPHLYKKIVESENGSKRGGYCMEANGFFGTVLLSLGFEVRMVGARIFNKTGKFGGWTHLVNLVTISTTTYLLDTGYGPNEPITPMPLHPLTPHPHVSPSQNRLLHQSIPQHLDSLHQKVWILQHRIDENSENKSESEWTTCYCFVETEFLPEDVVVMNMMPAESRHSFFTHKVVCVRMSVRGEDVEKPGSWLWFSGEGKEVGGEELGDEDEIDGSLILIHNSFKWRRDGKTVVSLELKDEEERLAVLEKYFGIRFEEEDRNGITGMASELLGTS